MNNEIFLARTCALHDVLTAYICALQEQSPTELAAWLARDPAVLAGGIIHHLRHSDGRILMTNLTR